MRLFCTSFSPWQIGRKNDLRAEAAYLARLTSAQIETVAGGYQAAMSAESDAEQALRRAYIACKLALSTLADLPRETMEAVEEPIREFCHSLEPFVGHLTDTLEESPRETA
jgi:hypothetical protein